MISELIYLPGPATPSELRKIASETSAETDTGPGPSTGETPLEPSLTPPPRRLKNPYISRKSLSFNTDPDMAGFEDVIVKLDTAG